MALDRDACRADDREAVQAAPAAAAARADRRQRLTAVPPGHVRRRERRNRQLVPRDRVDVPPEDGPRVRKEARAAPAASSSDPSPTSTAMRRARSGRSRRRSRRARPRERASTTRSRRSCEGLVTPAGRIFLSRTNHQGLQFDSMWVGRIQNCQVEAALRQGLCDRRRSSDLRRALSRGRRRSSPRRRPRGGSSDDDRVPREPAPNRYQGV